MSLKAQLPNGSPRNKIEYLADFIEQQIAEMSKSSDVAPKNLLVNPTFEFVQAEFVGAMGGYNAAFEYVKVDENVLDQVYAHDMDLVGDVEKLAADLESLPARNDSPGAVASQFTRAVEEVQNKFDARALILEGLNEK